LTKCQTSTSNKALLGSENKQQFPLFAISWGGANLFLIWDEGRGVSRG